MFRLFDSDVEVTQEEQHTKLVTTELSLLDIDPKTMTPYLRYRWLQEMLSITDALGHFEVNLYQETFNLWQFVIRDTYSS